MRPARLFRILLLLAATLPGFAQVEPNLRTVTDLSDPYKQVAAKSEVMAIYDFTPISRAVFEPFKYLTSQARNGFLPNAPTGQIAQNTGQFAIDVFNPYAPSGSQKFGAGVASPGSGNTPGNLKVASMILTRGSSRWAASQSVETSGSSVADVMDAGSLLLFPGASVNCRSPICNAYPGISRQ